MKVKNSILVVMLFIACTIFIGCTETTKDKSVDKSKTVEESVNTTETELNTINISKTNSAKMVRSDDKVSDDTLEITSVPSLDEVGDYSGVDELVVNNNNPFFIEEDYKEHSEVNFKELDVNQRVQGVTAVIGYSDIVKAKEDEEKRVSNTEIDLSCKKFKILEKIRKTKDKKKLNELNDKVDEFNNQLDNIKIELEATVSPIGYNEYNKKYGMIGYGLVNEITYDSDENITIFTEYTVNNLVKRHEREIIDYISNTGNHIVYRVTPLFKDSERVARGFEYEAYSVEDKGTGVKFNKFIYNIEPDVNINYLTGEQLEDEVIQVINKTDFYIINSKIKRFHCNTCEYVKDVDETYIETYNGDREYLINKDYTPCTKCNP